MKGCDLCNGVALSLAAHEVDSRIASCTFSMATRDLLDINEYDFCVPHATNKASQFPIYDSSERKIEYRSSLLQEAIVILHSTKKSGRTGTIHTNLSSG